MNVALALLARPGASRRAGAIVAALLLPMVSMVWPLPAAANTLARPVPACVMLNGPGFGGMVAAIDPETGRLTAPDAAQRERFAARATRGSARPAPTRSLDGSLRLDVRSWMRDFAIVRLGADGRSSFGCVDDQAKTVNRDAAVLPSRTEER